MSSFFLRLRTSQYITLIPLVLLLSFSIAYLARSIILLFFLRNSNPIAVQIPTQNSFFRQEILRPVAQYEETVTGNLVRGAIIDPNQERKIDGSPENLALAAEEGDTDQALLTGTISGHPSFARATIKEKGQNDSNEFAIGELLGPYRFWAIEQHYVVLAKKDFKFRVEIGETITQAKARLATKKGEDVPLTSSETIQKVLSREDVNKKLKNPAELYKDAKFGPNLVDGKIDGYKLYQVARTSIFYSLGARTGDIVKRVNGMPLQDTEKMLELWNSVKNAQKVTVDLDRGGKTITYEFIIRN